MCKMFCAAGDFSKLDMGERLKLHEFMSDLYRSTDYDRTDQDAMGVFAWSGDRIVHSRPALTARKFVESDDAWLSLISNPAKLYLCHQRGAMSPTKEINNHPFVGDNVALMHVGWIGGHFDIANKLGLKLESDTDTELFMRLADGQLGLLDGLETVTPVDVLRKLLKMTPEPTALALIHQSSDRPCIYFGRNEPSLHPFVFYRIPRFNGVFLTATEAMMIIAEQLTFDYPREAVFKITDVEPYRIYQMRWDSDTLTSYDK